MQLEAAEADDDHRICRKILADEAERSLAVQIDYSDRLEIERSRNLQREEARVTDVSDLQRRHRFDVGAPLISVTNPPRVVMKACANSH